MHDPSARLPRAWLLEKERTNPELRHTFTDWIEVDDSAFVDAGACLQRLARLDYGDTADISSTGCPLWGRSHDSRIGAIFTGLVHCRQRAVFRPETLLVVGSTDPSPHLEQLELAAAAKLNDSPAGEAFVAFVRSYSS